MRAKHVFICPVVFLSVSAGLLAIVSDVVVGE